MSINVDDTGAPFPGEDANFVVPLDELRALSWMDIRARIETRHPDLGAYLDNTEIPDAVAEHSLTTHVPRAYLNVLRTGSPDTSYKITVSGTPVRVAVAADRQRCKTDPSQEHTSWQQLRDIVATTTCAGIVLDLPPELVLAVWERDGQEIWACRPGTPTSILRKARHRRRRLTALSPLPLLGTVGQAVTSGTCAASFAFAPMLPAVPHSDSDPGVLSRPPAAAAHHQPQTVLPTSAEAARTDVFLPPVAASDFTLPGPTPSSTPTNSPTPMATPSATATVEPPPTSPSPTPSPTTSVPAGSPTPPTENPIDQIDNGTPTPEPEKTDQPAPAGDTDARSHPRAKNRDASEGQRHHHRPDRSRNHQGGNRGHR